MEESETLQTLQYNNFYIQNSQMMMQNNTTFSDLNINNIPDFQESHLLQLDSNTSESGANFGQTQEMKNLSFIEENSLDRIK